MRTEEVVVCFALSIFALLLVFAAVRNHTDSKESTKPTKADADANPCAAGHERNFVFLKKLTLVASWGCESNQGHPEHKVGHKVWYGRWVCRNCAAFGNWCGGTEGEWKVEHGKVAFDEKAFANFEYPEPEKKPVATVAPATMDLSEEVLKNIEEHALSTGFESVQLDCKTVVVPLVSELRRRRGISK